MLDYDLTRAEQVRRTDLAQKARRMILSHMKVEAEDETSLTLDHRGYYMQISFSPLHPLLVVCLAKAIRNPDGARKQQLANELNLHSVLGSHAINEDVGCYSYRATHWIRSSRRNGSLKNSAAALTKRIVAISIWQDEYIAVMLSAYPRTGQPHRLPAVPREKSQVRAGSHTAALRSTPYSRQALRNQNQPYSKSRP